MKVTASLNYLRLSPRKVRTVADLVRGMGAQEAVFTLNFLNKRASEPVRKLIQSAIANAEHNFALDPTSLKITTITVDGGPTLKRYRPKGMGRAGLIARRTSHVNVVLEGERVGRPATSKKGKTDVIEKPDTPTDDIREGREEQEKSLRDARKTIGKKKEDSFVKKVFRRKSI